MDKFKALRTMMDAVHPEHRAGTMLSSAAQTEELLAEIDRLESTIEAMHAARGGELMAEAAKLVAQQAGSLSEVEQLRLEQAAAVMPLIGPLLDAFEGAHRDDLEHVSTDLVRYLKAINSGMEGTNS